MTDKEYRTTRNKIIHAFKKWSLNLGLRHWDISAEFTRDDDNGKILASCHPDWEYKHGTITFHCNPMRDYSEKRITQVVIHELVHVLVHEMREWAPNRLSGDVLDKAMAHEERVVTEITDAIIWAYEAGAMDFKKGKYPTQKGIDGKKARN